jgi:hypothetical protein
LATLFFLNAVALLIFPAIGLGLSQAQFGVWSALAIHDTSSAVGAAMQYGPLALEIATTIKLTRALCPSPSQSDRCGTAGKIRPAMAGSSGLGSSSASSRWRRL